MVRGRDHFGGHRAGRAHRHADANGARHLAASPWAACGTGPTWSKEQPDKPTEWPLNPQHVKDVVDGMYGVVNEGGTGGRAWLPNIEVCGKTGTAQVASADFVKAAGGGRDLRDNAWFVGFAPRNAPEILVVALFEHGAEGPLAAPIVRDVMTAYFDKKARMVALRQQGAAVAAGEAAVRTLGLPGPGRSN